MFEKNFDCKTLREMGVSPEDYSTHSFRLGLSVLADGEVHPAFIQKSARTKVGNPLLLTSTLLSVKPYKPMTSCRVMNHQWVGALSILVIQGPSHFSYPKIPLRLHPPVQKFHRSAGPWSL